ncbi:MAG: acyl-CoA thioesterase [Opitutales bacterium]
MIHIISNFRVRYAETDRMDVVHHSNYLIWFEAARIQMLDEIGLPYREIEANGFFIPVLSATLDYKKPALFDDRIEVHLYMREKPRARFQFEYEVYKGKERLATGQTAHGFMDKNGKGIRPPEDFLKRIETAWTENKG